MTTNLHSIELGLSEYSYSYTNKNVANPVDIVLGKRQITLTFQDSYYDRVAVLATPDGNPVECVAWTIGESTGPFDSTPFGVGLKCSLDNEKVKPFLNDKKKYTLNIEVSDHDDSALTLFNNPELSDVEVHVGDRVLYLQKCILSSASPVFKAMLESGKIIIDGFTYAIAEECLAALYTERKVSELDLRELLKFSCKYELTDLSHYYQESLAATCTDVQYLDLLHFAIDNQLPYLKYLLMQKLRDNVKTHLKNHKKAILEDFGVEDTVDLLTWMHQQ